MHERRLDRLFVYLPTPPEHQDEVLLRTLAPMVRAVGDDPRPAALSFARSADPEPLIRIAASGEPRWIDERARPLLEEAARAARASVFRERDLPDFSEEVRRWGGEEGMALAERLFHHDSIASLERLELEVSGGAGRSRREWSLLLTEGFLDLLSLDRKERIEFYRRGHAWPFEQGEWDEGDRPILESKYQGMKDVLGELLASRKTGDRTAVWGGVEAAGIAERWLRRSGPAVTEWREARDAGRLSAEWGYLVWSVAHVHALRLGIAPIAEAILRFLVWRLIEDGILE